MDRDSILKTGSTKIVVTRAGVRQLLTFTIVREQTPMGAVPYLCSKKEMGLPELVRLANELCLPVRSKSMTVFPEKKAAHDFVGL